MRQLVDGGDVVLAKSYAPFGQDLYSNGSRESAFAFTGEQTDPNGLVYLRARYYGPGDGRFLSRDTWSGNMSSPMSLNRWNYVEGNPINYTDPSGHFSVSPLSSTILQQTLANALPNNVMSLVDTCSTQGVSSSQVVYPFLETSNNFSEETYNDFLCFKVVWEVDEWFPGGPKIVVPRLVSCESVEEQDPGSIFGNHQINSNAEEESVACKTLYARYARLIAMVYVLNRDIDKLVDELKNTTEPERREDLIEEINNLTEERDDFIKEMSMVYDLGEAMGCEVSGWPPPLR